MGICLFTGTYIEFDENNDGFLLNKLANEQNDEKLRIKSGVRRIKELKIIEDQSIDLILSNSVLEHVLEPQELFNELKRVLKNNGVMLHIVDYRDHFFRYPFHCLQFSERTWNTFLNPGDLTRYRLKDHIDVFNRSGFSVDTIKKSFDYEEFNKIKDHLNKRFRNYEPDKMAITKAVLLAKREHVEV